MNRVKKLINETKKYLRKYDYRKVIELCEEILEIDPSSTFALRFNAISYSQCDDYHKALEYYLILHEISPDEDTKQSIAYTYEKLGNYNKALEYLDTTNTNSWVQYKRKQLLTKNESFQELIDETDTQLNKYEKQDNSDDPLKKKIVLLEEKAVYQYLNKNYLEAIETFKNAYILYDNLESYSYYKDNFKDWYKQLHEYLEKYDNPEEFFNKFFTYDENIWHNKLRDVTYNVSAAYHMLFLELEPHNNDLLRVCAERFKYIDYDYSLECWNKILETEPENTDAINEILDIYSKQYSKDRALKLINEKLYINNIRPKLLSQKIKLLESMTLYDEANRVYDEYLSINMEENTYNQLTVFDKMRCMEQKALEYYLDKKLDESYNILREVSQIYNNTIKLGKYESWQLDTPDWYTNILTESIKQSNDNVEEFFRQYYKLTDKTTEAWKNKIQSLNNQNKLGNPITYCNILLNKNKNNEDILLTKAYQYYNTERYDEALPIYNKTIKLYDNNTAKNYKYNILIKHHQYKKAYKQLQSMKTEYGIINDNLYTLAKKLQEQRKYIEALHVYDIIYEETHRIELINKIKYLLIKTDETKRLHTCKYYMNWINLINYKYQSDNCPTCGKELIPIIYGYPAPETMKKADKGEIMLGGCCVSYDDPTHYCKQCKKRINLNLAIDITEDDPELAAYTRWNIYWINGYIKQHPHNTIQEIEKEAQKNGIDKQEIAKFIEKLEEIKHIIREKNTLKINE